MQADTRREKPSIRSRFATFWTLACFPLSLTSPGGTVAMGMTALYGLVMWIRGHRLDEDLRQIGSITLLAWGLIVVVDLINGGGLSNHLTVVDYLPVIALVPLALGIRLSGVQVPTIDRMMQLAILIAAVTSLALSLFLNVDRPGGLNLNPIPYAFVVLLWGTFQLARGLEGKGATGIVFALLAIVPIMLSGSKLVWACTALAYASVMVSWAWSHGRMKTLIPAAAVAVFVVAAGASTNVVENRMAAFTAEVQQLLATGMSSDSSLGNRLAMIDGGIDAFLDKPLLGHGLAQSMAAALAHADPSGPDISIHNHIHNDYVVHGVAYGIFGLAFLAIYFWILVRASLNCAFSAYRRAGIATALALALYMTADIAFNMDAMSGAMAIVGGLLLAFGRNTASETSATS